MTPTGEDRSARVFDKFSFYFIVIGGSEIPPLLIIALNSACW